jgi:hypothetical protein
MASGIGASRVIRDARGEIQQNAGSERRGWFNKTVPRTEVDLRLLDGA